MTWLYFDNLITILGLWYESDREHQNFFFFRTKPPTNLQCMFWDLT